MKGTPAIYLGRIVDKAHFRTKVYGPNGQKKIVESWDDFEAAMQSGLWFAKLQDAMESVPSVPNMDDSEVLKPKSKSRAKPKSKVKPVKVEKVEEVDGEISHDELDEMVYEVTE